MADTPSKPKTKKRLVKDPETFRQRAIKATESSSATPRKHRIKAFFGTILGPVFRPVGRALKFIFNRQPFRFIGKIIFPAYFRNSWQELRLVTWPSWKQSRQLTFAVIIFAVVFGGMVAALDYGLDKAFRHILLK